MKKRLNKKILEILEKQGYTQKKLLLGLILLFIVLLVFSIYYLYFHSQPCRDLNCFYSAMESCKRVSWIREDNQASWAYKIIGNKAGDACSVEVRLLKMKQGSISNEGLQDKKMVCEVLKSNLKFPESDIFKCSGPLKEEMQNILIQRMHNYLLENLGEIEQGFKGV